MIVDSYIIQRLYKEKGLTQETFADATGISRRTISTILREGVVKKKKDVQAMADALGVSQDILCIQPPRTSINIEGDHNRQNIAGDDNQVNEPPTTYEAVVRENEILRKALKAQEDLIELLKRNQQ